MTPEQLRAAIFETLEMCPKCPYPTGEDLVEMRPEQVEQERAFYASLTLSDRLWLQKAKVGV